MDSIPRATGSLPASARASWDRRLLLTILGIFLVSRAALLLAAHLAFVGLDHDSALPENLLSYLCRWDCGWYLTLAEQGYSTAGIPSQPGATNYAFFPLFPLLIRIAAPFFGGNYLPAAILVSNACFFAALLYIYRYARLLGHDEHTALLALAMLCIMPQSIVFSAAYSESVFLLLLAASIYHLRTEHYLAAACAAALLSATRANGIFILVFFLVWVIRRIGLSGLVRPWRKPELFVPIVLAPLGLFSFLGYCFITTGDAFAYSSTELYGWGWNFGLPWIKLDVLLRSPGVAPLAAIISMGVLACCLLLLRGRLYEEFALCTALIFLIWSGHAAASVFRYWIVLFPIWVALSARISPRPILTAMTISVMALLNGLMTCAWILQKGLAI